MARTPLLPLAGDMVRPGTLAMLHRVSPLYAGQLVLVQRQARAAKSGPACVIDSANRYWQVTIFGREISLRAKRWRDVCVEADCLQPLCNLSPAEVRTLTKRQARADFDQAVAAARRCLAEHPLTDDQLDATLTIAAHEALDRFERGVMPLLPKLTSSRSHRDG